MASLDAHGINKEGKVNKWIEEWLTNRLQQVVVLGRKSNTKDILAFVIQGSVLGPRLAKIFGNSTNDNTKMREADSTFRAQVH